MTLDEAKNDPSVAAFSARWRAKAATNRPRVPTRSTDEAVAQAVRKVGRRRKTLAFTALGLVASLGLAGCDLSGGVYALPLPGGADLGDDPLTLHVHMANVYDLVPQASVKAADVPVGKVTKITLLHPPGGEWKADVEVQVNREKAKLPANAVGELRQSSLLGEKYIQLKAPQSPAGTIGNNAVLQEDPSYKHVEVEQVLGALSLLLNEGGLPQIRTIAKELNSATEGHEQDIKGLLQQVNTLATHLDTHSDDITRALDGLNKLSATVNSQKKELVDAIDNIGPGLKVLTDQRAQLVRMLKALQNLSGVAIDTVNKTQADLIGDLKTLQPTLQKLNEAGDDLPNSLQMLLTFPFTDEAAKSVRGDYVNIYADLDLNLGNILTNLGRSRQNAIGQSVGNPLLKGILGGNTGKQATQSTSKPSTDGDTTTQPTDPTTGGNSSGQPPENAYGNGMGGIFGTLVNGGA